PILVVTGGGTGALSLNRLVVAAVPRLAEMFQIVHLTGRGRSVPSTLRSQRYQQLEFVVDELPHLLAAATLVVSRAGMGTRSELAVLGKPCVVVPLPDSHQWANAVAFARMGAVEVADQTALTPESLVDRLLSLLADPPRREQLSKAIGATMPRD